ncbi:MAG: nitrous oxide reductase family maturation protein NosD [Rhodothermales bacterium]|nr:nitrous oxide reductase family maturation protein NosD [Rhodothermales bacterium]
MKLAGIITFSCILCLSVEAQMVHTVSPADSIQIIVDNSSPGDTILFTAGIYQQPVLKIEKALVLTGEVGATLDGSAGQRLVEIYADDVEISSLTFRNVPKTFVDDRSAIRVESASNCRIEDNVFDNTFFAVYLANADTCQITGNTMRTYARRESEGGNAIHSWYSRELLISDNKIVGHRDGIYLEFTKDSVVRNNTSTSNLRYGLHFMFSDRCRYENNIFDNNGAGVAVMYANDIGMVGNTFSDAWGPASYGLLLKEIKGGEVGGNTFTGNSVALLVEGTDRLSFDGNTFENNGWGIKLMANSTDNEFTRNAFMGNSFDLSTNSLTAPSTFRGNYWDRYRGYDLDRDGVGDIPFRPVRLFSVIVEKYEASLILLHSVLVDALDAAERIIPALTPDQLIDAEPLMRRPA